MDKKLIQQYGEDILCYRLRTARQKKRMQYEDFHKHLIRLHKEDKALWSRKCNLGYEPLVPPVQKGWKRFYVLREDVAKSKHAEFFANILKKINTYDWSYRKDFLVKHRKCGRKKYKVRGQILLRPDEAHFAKLGFTLREKQFFHEEYFHEKWRGRIKRYVFNEPWRFVLRVRPNMIDKVKIVDGEIESRMARIDNYLCKNDYSHIQLKLLYGNNKWRSFKDFEKYNEKNPLKNKPLHEILKAAKEELI